MHLCISAVPIATCVQVHSVCKCVSACVCVCMHVWMCAGVHVPLLALLSPGK